MLRFLTLIQPWLIRDAANACAVPAAVSIILHAAMVCAIVWASIHGGNVSNAERHRRIMIALRMSNPHEVLKIYNVKQVANCAYMSEQTLSLARICQRRCTRKCENYSQCCDDLVYSIEFDRKWALDHRG